MRSIEPESRVSGFATRPGMRSVSRIIRPVGAAEDMDGLAGRQMRTPERRVDAQREIQDRHRADRVKGPDCYTFHRDASKAPARKKLVRPPQAPRAGVKAGTCRGRPAG